LQFLNDFWVHKLECPFFINFPALKHFLFTVHAAAFDFAVDPHEAEGLLEVAEAGEVDGGMLLLAAVLLDDQLVGTPDLQGGQWPLLYQDLRNLQLWALFVQPR
jgi:hypothetical protein